MATEIEQFISKARGKGLSDDEIRERLARSGWATSEIDEALDGLVVPRPPEANIPAWTPSITPAPNQPVSVVQNLSIRGFEYMVMFITLFGSAFSVGWLAHTFINSVFSKANNTYNYGQSDGVSTFAVTLLLVSFPIFAYMFLRLKKAELTNPTLRHDASRRKLTQLTQLVSFLIGLGYIIFFIYSLITPDTYYSYNSYDDIDNSGPGVVEQFLHMLITIVIAGGIFIYYWRDEHRKES